MEPFVALFVSAVLMAAGLYLLSLASEKEALERRCCSATGRSHVYLKVVSRMWRGFASVVVTAATMNVVIAFLPQLSGKEYVGGVLLITFYYFSAHATRVMAHALIYRSEETPDFWT